MGELNRREFVTATAAGFALAVLGDQLMAQDAPKMSVDIGKPADFPAGKLSDKFANSDKILVAHSGDKIYAMTAVCTHQRGTIALKDDKFRCPRHNSIFDETGKPTAGPAKTALARYAIAADKASGNLIVDKSKTFVEDKWTDAAAFYNTKAT